MPGRVSVKPSNGRGGGVDMWDALVCWVCRGGFRWDAGVSVPGPEFKATFATRRVCSLECARRVVGGEIVGAS